MSSTTELRETIAAHDAAIIALKAEISDVNNMVSKIMATLPQFAVGRKPSEVINAKDIQFRNQGPIKRDGKGRIMLDEGQSIVEENGKRFITWRGQDGFERIEIPE
jgi:hypothetical protein